MQIEEAIRTVIFSGKVVAVGFRNELYQLLVRHFVEFVRCDGLAYAPPPGFHFIPFFAEVFKFLKRDSARPMRFC